MKALALSAIVVCCASPIALAQTTTGTYCDISSDRIVSYYCNGGQPDGSWQDAGNGCFFRTVKGSCSAIADRNPVFDSNQYGQINGDVAASGQDRLQHWRNYGKTEGRTSSFGFSTPEYLNSPSNADLQSAYGSNYIAGIQHYYNYGFHEGRETRTSDVVSPAWPVYIYNPPTQPNAPHDGSYYFAIQRSGSGADNQALNTGLDTSTITGMPNPFRLQGRMLGPAQTLIDGQWGYTGVQEYGGQFGMGIDSRPVKDAVNAYNRGAKAADPSLTEALVTITLNQDAPGGSWQPWSNGGQGLRTAIELRIPFAGFTGPGNVNGSQVNTYYFLINKITGVGFYVGAAIFDTRSVPNPIAYNKDICGPGCGGGNIYIASILHNSPYLTVPGFSAESTVTTFNETRYFEYSISANNLRSIIAYAKSQTGGLNVTDNPEDFIVTQFNLNPEVFAQLDGAGNLSGDGWIGLSGRLFATGPQ